MRIIIRDILEPTIKRQEDDREEINGLKKMIENFKKRIDDLDYLVNRANFKTSKYDELKRQLNAMESNISIRHNETYQRMNEMTTKIEYSDKNIKNLFEITAQHAKNLQKIESDINDTRESILLTKTDLKETINSQWKSTLALNEKVSQKLNEVKENAEESMQQSQSNTNRINVIENLQDTISRLSTNNDIEIKNIWKQKVDVESYTVEVTRINNQFRSAAFSIETVDNNLKATDIFINRQMPFKIQYMMSETLHSFLDNKSRRRLLEWEETKFRYLKEYSLDERKVNRMAFMDDWHNLKRKNEDHMRKLQQEQREKDEKKEQEKMKVQQEQKEQQEDDKKKDGQTKDNKQSDLVYDYDDDAMNLIQKVEEQLDQIKYEFNLRQQSLTEKSDKMQESMENYFSSLNDQITEALKLRKRDKADHQQEFNKIMNQIDDAVKVTNTNQISLEALGQMVAALVECFKIQQILDRTEEQDKKTFGLYGIKENMKDGKSLPNNNNNSANRSFMDLESQMVSPQQQQTQQTHQNTQNIQMPQMVLPDIRSKSRERTQSQTGIQSSKRKKNDINITVDKKCLSCSGQSSMVLSAFKLACLNYSSSKVEYNTKVLDKFNIIDIREDILGKIFEKLRTTEPWRNYKLQM